MKNSYKNYTYIVLLFIFFLTQQLHAESNSEWMSTNLKPFIHQYAGFYTYDGDAEGNYTGEYAVILTDGSAWKIHASNTKELASWDIGDKVHIEVRTFWYFYRRDHKFILFNHKKKKGLYAMLVYSRLKVHEAETPVPTSDNPFARDYKQNLILTDGYNGYCWEVDSYKKDKRFSKGTPAYVGYNAVTESTGKEWGTFFIIGGKGKNAQWDWARQGNYTYVED